MGWVMLALVAVGVMLVLWRLGMPRNLWTFVGSALMLGAAGYALQGRPAQPGSPVKSRGIDAEADTTLVALRGAMFGRFGRTETPLAAADGLARAGAKNAAVRVMLGAVNDEPRNAAYWTWLAMAYLDHDGNTVSPAAQLAFSRAIALAPNHPGPAFFRGMAYVRAGEFAKARPWWRRALALTPRDVSYRNDIVTRLFLLEQFLQAENVPPR